MNHILIGEFNVDSLFCTTEGTGIFIGNRSGYDIIEVRDFILRVLMGWVTVYYELYQFGVKVLLKEWVFCIHYGMYGVY